MKKFFSFLSASVALALAFVSCQKNQETDFTPASRNIKFYASELVTKTTFGTPDAVGAYPVLWTSNQQVSISMNKASAVKADVAPDETGATAEFTPVKEFAADGSSTYTFYAISPSNAVISDISAKKDDNYYNRWSVQIPADQTPLEKSADELAQILVAQYTEGKAGVMPESVTFNFSHLTAYGKLSLVNLALESDEAVASVSLEAEEEWAGRWFYYVEDSEVDTDIKAGTWAENGTAGTNIISLKTDKTSDIWFACRPVDMGGKTIKVSVNTNKGRVFKKTITIPAGYKFQAGHIASFGVNMAGVTPEGAKTYVLIKDVSEIQEGEEIIIVAGDAGLAMGTTQNTNNRAASEVTIDTNTDGKSVIVNPSATVLRLNIAEGNKAGTFALETINGGESSGYIYAASSSSNSLKTETTLTDNSSWEIEIVGGIASFTAQGTYTRNTLRYNSGSNIFSCYAPTSTTGTLVRIFMLNGVGNEPVKAPVSIAVSDASTNFEVGGTYAFDGKVTLTYNDGTTKELTDSEYTVDASAVDMTTAGTYTVTVTLKEDSSITDSYDVNVVSNEAKNLPYENTLVNGHTDFTIESIKDGGNNSNWKDTEYGITANAYGRTSEVETYLVSPVFDATSATSITLSFEHNIRYFASLDKAKEQAVLQVKTETGAWTNVTIPTWSTNTNNTFVSTSLPLDSYAGNKIQLRFKFLANTTDNAGRWEIKNFKIEGSSSSAAHGVTVEPTTITLSGASGSSAVVNATSNYEVTYEILSGSGFSVVQDGKKFTVTADADGGTAEATLGTLRIKESADATAFADVTVKQSAKTEASASVFLDLSKDETATASKDLISWNKDGFSLEVAKGTSTTNANNYYGGDTNKRTSTRFYNGMTLTLTPPSGKTVLSIVFTATSVNYANALKNSTWTNASAAVSETKVTVTPTDGTTAVSAKIGATCGFTGIEITYN